ncbi:MAG TPA: P1 family peptidase [Candidatus Xenobia bacterium]|jgi:L-aminopeptidase/D-esterase-like protein
MTRARQLGIRCDGEPGPHNAITDVPGVEVGYCTLVHGEGPLVVGQGPVRTGVTAILPRGRHGDLEAVFGGSFSLNGCGEMTGMAWLEESGHLEGPVLLTNTASVGAAHQASIEWQLRQGYPQEFSLPVVAETYDGWLNDINGFHVRREHIFQALDTAASGPLAEGNVGGGTGMICFEFKGGTGTASRQTALGTVGVLVQANFGRRHQLLIHGLPVGQTLRQGLPVYAKAAPESGSIIVVVATDAPLLPHACKRLARRAAMGLARTGSIAGNSSGDLMLAFSTANRVSDTTVRTVPIADMNDLFTATIQATEEAILNALVAAESMVGRDGHQVARLPHADLQRLL